MSDPQTPAANAQAAPPRLPRPGNASADPERAALLGLPAYDLSPGAQSRAARIVEAAAVFAIGCLAMLFFLFDPSVPAGPDMGLPGNDSFYHVKMSLMLPEVGLVDEFPWLQFAYFTKQGHGFVSHHYGFHALMLPFLKAAQWTSHDPVEGARWANAAFFGLVVLMFFLILKSEGVPYLGLWLLAFFLFMPIQFYTRHAFVRAISPSLFAMLLLVWSLFRRRWLMAGIVTALSNHLYLGGVMYSPVIVAAFAFASIFGPRGHREFPWKVVLAAAIGWLIGVVTYPYRDGMFEFLKLQVFGTGLTPDIEVGSEWKPYSGVWWFVQFAGFTLAIWAAALLSRLRLGPALSANEMTLVLLNFAFLVLTLKARRFIEYWPAFSILCSAVLARPLLQSAADWFGDDALTPAGHRGRPVRVTTFILGLILLGIVGYNLYAMYSRSPQSVIIVRFLDVVKTWQFQAVAAIALTLGTLLDTINAAVGRRGGFRAWPLMPVTTILLVAATLGGSTLWTEIRRSSRTTYDVPEIRNMMAALQADARPGDIVFTSDWDDFPVYFYYNSHNHYVVGLDPKFTHERRPDLWERYVRITRGQIPTKSRKKFTDVNGREYEEMLDIRVQDIRDKFNARYVISDNQNKALSNKVAAASGFAELLYPEGGWKKNQNAPYVVWKIVEESPTPESAPAPDAAPTAR